MRRSRRARSRNCWIRSSGLLDFDEKQLTIAKYLLASVDARGYLRMPVEEIASDPALNATVEEVQAVVERLRPLGPPGLFAKDLRECLLLQLKAQLKENAPTPSNTSSSIATSRTWR